MSIFKCKMCGGNVEFEEGASVGVCDSCGTKQTLPKLDDDKKANLYDRANHFRRNNDYDKAAGIYEQILNEDNTDAEAYWSLVLCRYGIEYVEDPTSHKRIPTVNRAQFTSIYMDEDYKSALKYADGYQKVIYEQEAKAIDEIQKGILEISSKEEPFDVFICYKETDNSGRRTPDSVLANDLYHQLTQEGFKVFFARITLEDKLGTAYEPYIFAALNSSKVMVALGTKPEYFNAVWVKNEWSRYLALIKNGEKKMLIPAYKDMDPYDLPEEFSHLQAQDMGKLGFMQDLIRGIRKILNTDEEKPTVVRETVVASGNANVQPLLKRAFMFLEDGDFKSADEYCEKVLDIDPENGHAYLGKLMAELKVKVQEKLKDCAEPFDESNNYQKAVRYSSKEIADLLKEYVETIKNRNEKNRLINTYNEASEMMNSAKNEEDYLKTADKFESIKDYKNSAELCKKCRNKAEEISNEKIYQQAEKLVGSTKKDFFKSEYFIVDENYGLQEAIKLYKKISGWKDADVKIEQYQRKIEEMNEKKERKKKKAIKVTKIVSPIVAVCVVIAILIPTVIIPKAKFNKAMKLVESGDYDNGYAMLEELSKFDEINKSKLDRGLKLVENGDYSSGYFLINESGNSDVVAKSKYDRAMEYIEKGDDDSIYLAYTLLNGLNYQDSEEKKNGILPQYINISLKRADVGSIVYFGSYEQDNDTSNGKEVIEWQVLAKEDNKALIISKYALDCVQYNSEREYVTWETCSLRKWLNETFINSAFNSDEQALIPETNVSAGNNPEFSTNPGNATKDKIFLLSINEVNKYFSSDDERMCAATDYAKAQGAYISDDNTVGGKWACWWWLRSPGFGRRDAAGVRRDGWVSCDGELVNYGRGSVRPALWITLES